MGNSKTKSPVTAPRGRRATMIAFLLGLSVGKVFFSFSTSMSSFREERSTVDFAPPQTSQGLQKQTQKQTQVQTQVQDASESMHVRRPFDAEGNIGIVSKKDPSFFRAFQEQIDSMDDEARCDRYQFKLKSKDKEFRRKRPRRIFFGALVATETWELFDIVSTEAYGIYDGIVLVESNRTQNLHPRNLTHYNQNEKHEAIIGELFGVPSHSAKIRFWSNEDEDLSDLPRESAQRDDVLNGWRELGMQPDDVGILSDMDEVLTRDFLRAIQVCDVIDEIDYRSHGCRPDKMGLRTVTQIYEGSPECVTDERYGFQPSVFSGHCIEGIGDPSVHKSPPRNREGDRLGGWGQSDWDDSKPYTPSANGGDFRTTGGARNINLIVPERQLKTKRHYNVYTAYHFHNFFSKGSTIRFKYKTYGHPNEDANLVPLQELQSDLAIMVYCAKNEADPEEAEFHRVVGGFESLDPFTPIYFQDAEYRFRRQEFIQKLVRDDENDQKKRREEEMEERKTAALANRLQRFGNHLRMAQTPTNLDLAIQKPAYPESTKVSWR